MGSHLVPVQKKYREILRCVDFKNLNRASTNDKYLVPLVGHILQAIFGLEIFSILDGFLGYNQVLFSRGDRVKTMFNTKWGTFKYKRMPFGLINARVIL